MGVTLVFFSIAPLDDVFVMGCNDSTWVVESSVHSVTKPGHVI